MDPQCPSPQMRQAFDVWYSQEYPVMSCRIAEGRGTPEDKLLRLSLQGAFWNGMSAAVQVLSEEGSLR